MKESGSLAGRELLNLIQPCEIKVDEEDSRAEIGLLSIAFGIVCS